MIPISRLALFVACVCGAVACVDVRAPNQPVGKALADFRTRAAAPFAECSDEKCVETALASCAPVHLLLTFGTIEGTRVTMDYFVVREGDACRVVTFADHSKDSYGGCALITQTCPTLTSNGNGCSPAVTLYKAKVCRNRFGF